MMSQTNVGFSILDLIIFCLPFAGSFLIGIYHVFRARKSSTDDYILGSKNMGILPVSASLISSHFSAVYLLGIATEVYYFGGFFFLCVFEGIFSAIATAYIYLPVFYKIQCTSIYEYLELRFNKTVQMFATVVFHLQALVHLSFIIYAPALIVSQATNLGLWTCIMIISLVCIFYTSLGGIKAVMWTDTYQCTFMLTSVFAVIIIGCNQVGGISYVWQKNVEHNKLNLLNFDLSISTRYTVWTIIIGSGANSMTRFASGQAFVQRYLSTSSLKSARWTVFFNFLGSSIFIILTTFAGLILYATYWDCDPFQSKKINAKDQILPFFVLQQLGPDYVGLPGLFAAGLLSCAISTLSSIINSMSTVTFKQVIQPLFSKKTFFQNHPTIILKLISTVYGVLTVAFIPIVQKAGGIFAAFMSFLASLLGPLFGIFTLGMLFPRASSKCALIGAFVSMAITTWFSTGAIIFKPNLDNPNISVSGCNYSNNGNLSIIFQREILTTEISNEKNDILWVYKFSYLWYRFISIIVTIVIGMVVSFFDNVKHVNPDLISPVVYNFKSCFKRENKMTQKKVTTNINITTPVYYEKVSSKSQV